jgi:hypothetical protein
MCVSGTVSGSEQPLSQKDRPINPIVTIKLRIVLLHVFCSQHPDPLMVGATGEVVHTFQQTSRQPTPILLL